MSHSRAQRSGLLALITEMISDFFHKRKFNATVSLFEKKLVEIPLWFPLLL